MKVYPIRYTKADLERVPIEERLTFVMACQLGNDNQILKKQVVAATNYTSETEAIRHGHIANATLNMRLWAGRLHEVWNFQRDRLGRLCRQYETDLPEDAKAAWRGLNAYFSQDNLISRLRNKVGFHSDFEIATRGYEALPANEPLVDYLADQQANILYFSAEMATASAMFHLTGKSGVDEALDCIFDELQRVASSFDAVINGVAEVFIARHLDPTPIEERAVELKGLPRLDDISVGFFFEPPKG